MNGTYENQLKITCGGCKIPLLMIVRRSPHGPNNSEVETARCPECEFEISARCFGLDLRPVPPLR